MKRLFSISVFALMVLLTFFYACKPDPQLDFTTKTAPISFPIPQGWPKPFYNFENNTLTSSGFELGRKLFYDQRLSRDNTISCGSCHQQFAGFAQADHAVSHGVDDKLGVRNSPALFNMNWHTSFFWDGGVNHIESQPINPIKNPVEMDESIDNIIVKLNADATYRSMFKSAFGDETINSQRIFKALAQFMGMLVSSNSKYDKYKRSEAGITMTTQELNGYDIYKSKCSNCHTEPLFTDYSFKSNGLPLTVIKDSGRAHITLNPADLYKFKIPSLRNLKYTGPYMHDGRFNTLDEVLNHYATGISASSNPDAQLAGGIQLTTQQRADLIAFLNTLNDEEFIKDERFKEVK
ncbi:MAG: c-type cytochrome [Bacteroidetes bacterium]|nr:c-type cytochrome [Bacteroidota bacterium]